MAEISRRVDLSRGMPAIVVLVAPRCQQHAFCNNIRPCCKTHVADNEEQQGPQSRAFLDLFPPLEMAEESTTIGGVCGRATDRRLSVGWALIYGPPAQSSSSMLLRNTAAQLLSAVGSAPSDTREAVRLRSAASKRWSSSAAWQKKIIGRPSNNE